MAIDFSGLDPIAELNVADFLGDFTAAEANKLYDVLAPVVTALNETRAAYSQLATQVELHGTTKYLVEKVS